jgi:hypothetical protein
MVAARDESTEVVNPRAERGWREIRAHDLSGIHFRPGIAGREVPEVHSLSHLEYSQVDWISWSGGGTQISRVYRSPAETAIPRLGRSSPSCFDRPRRSSADHEL